ncbi:MAG: hypothetical protein LQ343_001848 [Gyalolechia ehrenbergii]|nr:MAG: hypothetical protein LQ343_001848 [Gyalolechia ehrenbergii]
MAPLRNNRSSNRSGRSQIDHDVFEGLPVRHWRKASVAVNTALQKDEPTPNPAKETLFFELTMPRDAQLLPPMSQALLRAARSGEITKKAPQQPLLEDDKENGEDDDALGDADLGFMAKRWAAVPRHLEGPEPEFLAKRRKGLPSAYTGPLGQATGPTPMRKTRVKKIDGDGNATVLDVLVPEGQTIEGEVVEEEAKVTQAPAPGTVVEGVGVANAEGVIVAGDQMLPTPPRRRPPPPKRKAKGPGRGRKKKVAFAPGSEGQNPPGTDATVNDGPQGVNGLPEGQSGNGMAEGDITMGYENTLQNGEESSEEDDDGEEGNEGDKEEGELSPSPPSSQSPSRPLPPLEHAQASALKQDQPIPRDTEPNEPRNDHTSTPDLPQQRDAASSPDLPFIVDQDIDVLSALSKPIDDRVLATGNEQALLSVEEPPSITEQAHAEVLVAAEVPPEHNPLNGLAGPKPSIASDQPPEQESQLSDGEVDLLGSLEKQLNDNDVAVNSET